MKIKRAHRAGVVLGIGLGGFVDGILLHMILRWHHMLSNVVPPDTRAGLHTNMMWDGYFHVLTWVITLIGIFMLWGVVKRQPAKTELPTTTSFTEALIIGWTLFNLVEGVIDHHLLALHNVREVAAPRPWNIGFLVIGGGLLLGLGWRLQQSGHQLMRIEQVAAADGVLAERHSPPRH